jgi:hypothetical protein
MAERIGSSDIAVQWRDARGLEYSVGARGTAQAENFLALPRQFHRQWESDVTAAHNQSAHGSF